MSTKPAIQARPRYEPVSWFEQLYQIGQFVPSRVGEAVLHPTENPESPIETLSTRKRSYRIELHVVAAGDHEALSGGEHVVPVKKNHREMSHLLGLAEAATGIMLTMWSIAESGDHVGDLHMREQRLAAFGDDEQDRHGDDRDRPAQLRINPTS